MTTMATRLPRKTAETTEALHRAFEPARLVLPYPPSINALWRNVNGRSILSKEYRDWIKAAGEQVMIQRQKRTVGRVGISVVLVPPDKRRRDLDNVGFKAIIDLLVKHGLIEGDDSRYVRAIHAAWQEQGHPCVVTIKPAVF
jgi:crossover junction endodeoxyribonuclease RusA